MVALAMGLLVYGSAFAQGESESNAQGDAAQGQDDETLSEASKLSNDEKRKRAETMLSEMRDALARGTEILAEARASKDVVQMNCVNEKLTQIKALLKLGEQASVRMYDGIAQAADDVINHEFTRLSVAHQRSKVLRSEADQCVGEQTIYTGETEIEVEIDPNLAPGDPTATPDPPMAPESPEVASKA